MLFGSPGRLFCAKLGPSGASCAREKLAKIPVVLSVTFPPSGINIFRNFIRSNTSVSGCVCVKPSLLVVFDPKLNRPPPSEHVLVYKFN